MNWKFFGRQTAMAVGIALVGIALAFFFVFRTLFTDAPQNLFGAEMMMAQGLTLAVYAVATALWARFGPSQSLAWLALLAAPGILVIAAYWDPSLGLRAITFIFVAAGIAAGWFAGRKWRAMPSSGMAPAHS